MRISMSHQFVVFSLVAMLAVPAGNAGGQGSKKLAELDGTWRLIKMEVQGKSLLRKGEKWKFVIKEGKLTSNAKNAPKKTLRLSKFLDPTKKPKTVTYAYEGKLTFYGIYEVKGDELRVCGDGVDTATEKNPEARRPKTFDSNKGLLLVLKREKK
jgi:uncharacterized protein (TIGR03067 family)